ARMRSESGLYYGMDFLQSATGLVHLYVRMCADSGSTRVQTVSLSCRSLSCVCVCVCVCVWVCVCVCVSVCVPLLWKFRFIFQSKGTQTHTQGCLKLATL